LKALFSANLARMEYNGQSYARTESWPQPLAKGIALPPWEEENLVVQGDLTLKGSTYGNLTVTGVLTICGTLVIVGQLSAGRIILTGTKSKLYLRGTVDAREGIWLNQFNPSTGEGSTKGGHPISFKQ